MPAGALRCNECNTYKKYRRLPIWTAFASTITGPLALITAIISLSVVFYEARSHTRFKMGTADDEFIHVKVWNTGKKPSALVRYRLQFDNLPGKEVVLVLKAEDVAASRDVVVSPAPVDLSLAVPDWTHLPDDIKANQFTKDEVTGLPGWESSQPMTLIIDVQESSDDAGGHHEGKDHFLSGRISRFIKQNWGPQS